LEELERERERISDSNSMDQIGKKNKEEEMVEEKECCCAVTNKEDGAGSEPF
jgi:hypothetical protein